MKPGLEHQNYMGSLSRMWETLYVWLLSGKICTQAVFGVCTGRTRMWMAPFFLTAKCLRRGPKSVSIRKVCTEAKQPRQNLRRKTGDFQDAIDDEIPVPTERVDDRPAAPPELGLQDIWDLLQRGMRSNETNFADIKRDVRGATQEAKEAKIQAAKATTLSQETKQSLESLEQRVAKLEKGHPAAPPGLAPSLAHPRGNQTRDWDRLGGEQEDTIVIGGFREYADSDERRGEWQTIKALLAPELAAEVAEEIVPRAPGPIILIKLRKEATAKDTWGQEVSRGKTQAPSRGRGKRKGIQRKSEQTIWHATKAG